MGSQTAPAGVFEEIERCEVEFRRREETLQAFLPEQDRFPRIRRDAEDLLRSTSKIAPRTPVFGKLLGVKDIFRVNGFATRAGSQLPPRLFEGAEASSVSALKAAGALVMGKTVTTEFAYFAPGPTRNPWALDHTPGGSSSGSAAAVAAGFCTVALGTQTIGSIIRPAAYCGVVGFKPTYGRVSADGIIPLSPSLDHAGIFAQSAAMAHSVAAILCNEWSSPGNKRRQPILGIPEGPYLQSATSAGLANFERVCDLLRKAGFEIRRVAAMPDFLAVRDRHQVILAAEASRVHKEWFAEFSQLYAPKTAELIRRGETISDADLARAIESKTAWQTSLDRFMEENGIDVWLSPSATGTAPKGLDSTGDPIMNLPWTQAGLPVLSLPSGKDTDGLPFGLQITAGRGADESLLAWASELEGIVAEA
jgi:Asp-tRNA(Asn)/Glu-tRNA(Gln) amidotransferase A subunit family amidase